MKLKTYSNTFALTFMFCPLLCLFIIAGIIQESQPVSYIEEDLALRHEIANEWHTTLIVFESLMCGILSKEDHAVLQYRVHDILKNREDSAYVIQKSQTIIVEMMIKIENEKLVWDSSTIQSYHSIIGLVESEYDKNNKYTHPLIVYLKKLEESMKNLNISFCIKDNTIYKRDNYRFLQLKQLQREGLRLAFLHQRIYADTSY